jgi:hypothetical protein
MRENQEIDTANPGWSARLFIPATSIALVLVTAGLAWLLGTIGGADIDLPALLGAVAMVGGTAVLAAVALGTKPDG